MSRMTLARAGATIVKRWRVPEDLARAILDGRGDDHILERLAILVSIHVSLRRIFIEPQRAYAWVHRPNVVFGGQSPLQVMAQGDVASLRRIRSYLSAEVSS